MRLNLTLRLSFAQTQRRKGLVRDGELGLERLELRLLLRDQVLVLRGGLLRRFDAGRGGHLGGLVLGLGGHEVSDILFELGQLILLGKDADIELGGLESDDAFAVRSNLGRDIARLGLGGGEFGPDFSKLRFGGAESDGGRLHGRGFLGEIDERGALGHEFLGRLLLLGGRLGLADHALPVGDRLVLFDDLGLHLGELLRGGFSVSLHLGQCGFSGGNTNFDGLRGGFGGRERGLEFSQAFLGGHHAVDNPGRITGNLDDLATGRGLKETDLSQPVAGDEGLGVVETDDAGNLIVLLDALSVLESLTVDAPHRGGAVGSARNQSAIRQEGDGLHIAAMGTPGRDLLAGLHLPGGNNPIGGAASEDVRVRAPSEVGDAALMLAEIIEFAAVVGFPDIDIAVAVRGREQDTVRTKVGTGHPIGVLGDEVELLAGSDVEALHLLGIGGEDDLAMVRRDIGRHHLVELFANLGDTLASLDVPDDGVANLATATTAHDQQRTVGAKLQRTGITFGVGQDAGEVVRVGVVEENLLLAGDGEERSPGARRHGDDRGSTRRHDDRLEQDVFRTGHRAGGFAGAAGEGKVNLGLIGGLRDATLRLEHATGDPLGKQRQVLGLERRAFRRHEGLFLVRTHGPQAARLRIACIDDGAAAATVH